VLFRSVLLNAVRCIEEDWQRDQALVEHVRELAASSRFDKAFSCAGGIDRARDHNEALADLAQRLTDAGKTAFAHEGVRAMTDPSRKVDALGEIAAWHANCDRSDETDKLYDEALEIANAMESRQRAEALVPLVEHLAVYDIDRAKAAAHSIELESDLGFMAATHAAARARACMRVALQYAHLGRLDDFQETSREALAAAQRIENPHRRTKLLCELAESLAESGTEEVAHGALEAAHKAAKQINAEDRRGILLGDIVTILLNLGSTDQALAIAEDIDFLGSRSVALQSISDWMAEKGKFSDSLQVATSIDRDREDIRNKAISSIVMALANSDQTVQALHATHRIDNFKRRARTISKLAEHHIKRGATDAFVEHMDSLELNHEGWNSVVPKWQENLIRHTSSPEVYLRQSLTLDPFNPFAGWRGAFSLVQAHIQTGGLPYAEAIARLCPELELSFIFESSTPKAGLDPDELPSKLRAKYDTYNEMREEGLIDEETFEAKVETLFELA